MDAWSRGLSFVNEMAEKDGVHKTKGDMSRFQLATNSIEKGSCFMSNSECIIEVLNKRCYNKRWPGQESHEELCGCCVEASEERN